MSFYSRVALAAAGLFIATTAYGAEIRTVPGDSVILNPVNPDKGFSDLVVHTIAVATGANETLQLDSVRVDILDHGRAVVSRELTAAELVAETGHLASAPIPEFIEGQFLNSRGIDGFFGRHVSFASSPTLGPSQALLAMRLHFSVDFAPDAIRFTVAFHNSAGAAASTTATIPVVSFKPAIVYRSPLEGQWLMTAVPGVQSHHRFNPCTEFAVDFFKLGPDGHVAHGDEYDPKSFYGFATPVMAAASGKVVFVIADQTQNRGAFIRKPGESDNDFSNRVDAYHMATMAKNFRAANAGNIVTIRHEANGVVEYTSYGHLKTGSVRVKIGDSVKQGEIIGEVGDTGDSSEVHLHFQVNTGPDAFMSKSLPAVIANLHNVDGNDELGRLVTTADN